MRSRGYTLVELVVVIVLIGVLSVVALVRFDPRPFGVRAASLELIEAIRYAQLMSMAQGGVDTYAVRIESSGYRVLKNDTTANKPFGDRGDYVSDAADWRGIFVDRTGKIAFGPRGEPNCSDGLRCSSDTVYIQLSRDGVSSTIGLEPVTGYVR